MSSIDFTRMRSLSPDLAEVWEVLEAWDGTRRPGEPLVLLELMDGLCERVGPTVLIGAIDELVEAGQLRRAYRVMEPEMRQLLPDSYSARSEIPERVMDLRDQWIDVQPEMIRSVLLDPADEG